MNDGSCDFFGCYGCVTPSACNYDADALYPDGSCTFPSEGQDCDGNCIFDSDGDAVCDSNEVSGCTDVTALNFNPNATDDNGSCTYITSGCTDQNACNFDTTAQEDDGTCEFNTCAGCVVSWACNYSADATYNDGSCIFPDANGVCPSNCLADSDGDGVCDEDEINGCTNVNAVNYEPEATEDDGSCLFSGCTVVGACNYDPAANINDGTCDYFSCVGCQNPVACNYAPDAIYPGQCTFPGSGFDCDGNCIDSDGDSVCDNDEVDGCTDATAINYDADATEDNGTCIASEEGCTDIMACNYNPLANTDDGLCEYISCSGCTELSACNYDSSATQNDGSCVHLDAIGICGGVCTSDVNQNGLCDLEELEHATTGGLCGPGTIWDEASQLCLPLVNPSDLNLDGCVDVQDFMGHLAAFGSGCEEEIEEEIVETPWQCGDPLTYQGYDYATVLIGEQCWFAENLRNKKFGNGDAIASNLSANEWQSTTTGAIAVYGEIGSCGNYSPDIDACDASQSLNEYGRLYNWYAVDDPRGLCPSGWHVPSDSAWTVLTNDLAGDSVAGGQMKTDYGWYDGGMGTNFSGFSGLPGGARVNLGTFQSAGRSGYWWSSSRICFTAFYRSIGYSDESIYRNDEGLDLRSGFSVRCVRDAE